MIIIARSPVEKFFKDQLRYHIATSCPLVIVKFIDSTIEDIEVDYEYQVLPPDIAPAFTVDYF